MRLIDADAFERSVMFDKDVNDMQDVIYALRDFPSAEPEIIRCRDCLKREICRTTTIWAVAPDDDWFCADGERRTDG